MKYLLLLLALSMPLSGQIYLEDFACQVPTNVTPGNPTVVDCPASGGHGFTNYKASAKLALGSTTQASGTNATITIGPITYRLVASLAGCSPYDVLLSTAEGVTPNWLNTIHYLAAAIEGADSALVYDGTQFVQASGLRGTKYCTGTNAHPLVTAAPLFATSSSQIIIRARTGGAAGEIAVSRVQNGNTGLNWYRLNGTTATTQLNREWAVKVSGASGDAACSGFNSTGTPRYALAVDDDTFSVNYNSSSCSSFAGMPIVIRRASHSNYNFFYHSQGDFFGAVETPLNGLFGLKINGCTATDTPEHCATAFQTPDNQKNYGDKPAITSFVVSGGIATVTTGAWGVTGTGYTRPGLYGAGHVDSLGDPIKVMFRGFEKYWRATAITAFADNGSGFTRVTAASHGCAAGDQAYITGVSGSSPPGGTLALTVVSSSQVDLPTVAYAGGWSGGTLTCNAQGRAAQTSAGAYSDYQTTGIASKAHLMTSYTAGTNTFTIPVDLVDGVYTGSTLQARIQERNAAYMYIYPQIGSGASYYVPNDMFPAWVKTGNPPAAPNRLRMWVKWGTNRANSAGSYTQNLGTYVVPPDLPAESDRAHFYHYTGPNIYNGVWTLYEFTNTPSHQVGASGAMDWPEDPTIAGHPYYPAWAGGNGNGTYLQGANVTYFSASNESSPVDTKEEAQHYFGRIEMGSAADEPEEQVRSRTAVFSTQRYIGGALTANQGYEVTWSSMAWNPQVTFKVRYSTSGSIKTGGWSSATDGGTASLINGATGGVIAQWQSPTMAEAANFYAAIRPVVPIVAATPAGSDIWLVTRGKLSMGVGHDITVSGAGGNRDGAVEVAEVKNRQVFWIDRPATAASPEWQSGGGTLTNIVAASGTCTANFSVNHNLPVGWLIEIQGSNNATLGGTPVNYSSAKKYTVASVPTAQSLTFSCASVPDGTYNTNASGQRMSLHAFPGIRIAGTASTAWSGTGTIESREENIGFAEVHLPQYDSVPPPPAPSGLAAVSAGLTAINLSWTDVSSMETGYRLERRTGIAGPWAEVAQLGADAVAYTDTGLGSSTQYYYRIRAVGDGGLSDYSNEAEATTDTPAPAIPAAASGLAVSGIYDDRMTLSWTDNAVDEAAQRIEVNTGAGWYTFTTVSANVTSHLATGLVPAREHQWRIVAVNAYGDANASNVASGTTLGVLPDVRLAWIGHGVFALAYHAPNSSEACLSEIPATGETDPDTADTPRSRLALLHAVPGSTNQWRITCQTASARGTVTLPEDVPSGGPTFAVAAMAPVGADTLAVDYGADSALGQLVMAACVGGQRCSVHVPKTPGAIVFLRRRWLAGGSEIGRSALERVQFP